MALPLTPPGSRPPGPATPYLEPAERLEDLEVDLLLEAVYRHYGYDFREYARASIKRRLWRRVYAERVETLSGLQERVLHDPASLERPCSTCP
jgi:chemotaxis protein methyltransferase CheR